MPCYNDFKIPHAMIDKPEDIEATVLALEAQVPAGCETFAPPRPPTSAVVTRYFGNVRVVEAFDPVEGVISGGPIFTTGKRKNETQKNYCPKFDYILRTVIERRNGVLEIRVSLPPAFLLGQRPKNRPAACVIPA